MPDNVLLVIAERDGRPIAAALDLFSPAALYGRYWGAIEFVPGLHFEACYYQAIEFASSAASRSSRAARRASTSTRAASCRRRRDPSTGSRIRRSPAPSTITWRAKAPASSAYVDELNERSPFKEGADANRRIGDGSAYIRDARTRGISVP